MGLPIRDDTYTENLSQAETLGGPMDLPSPPPPAALMPINPTERDWRTRRGAALIPGHVMDRAKDVLHTTKQSAGRMYREARRKAAGSYARLSQQAGEAGRQTRDVARYAQRTYPVRVLGIIAASAFVVGVGIRVWRSRR